MLITIFHNSKGIAWAKAVLKNVLIRWGREKVVTILQTTFLNWLYWMKNFEFWSQFNRRLHTKVQLTISQHWFREWLVPNRPQAFIWTNDGTAYQCIYVSPSHHELIKAFIQQIDVETKYRLFCRWYSKLISFMEFEVFCFSFPEMCYHQST